MTEQSHCFCLNLKQNDFKRLLSVNPLSQVRAWSTTSNVFVSKVDKVKTCETETTF